MSGRIEKTPTEKCPFFITPEAGTLSETNRPFGARRPGGCRIATVRQKSIFGFTLP
jgi:hypothetical protein